MNRTRRGLLLGVAGGLGLVPLVAALVSPVTKPAA
jgi:hypothetical protein